MIKREIQQEYELSKERSQLVVKNNDLIQKARYNLTSIQQKFLAYIISKIKPTDTELTEYEIRVEDFCLLTGIDKTYFYSDFIELVDDLDNNKSFWIETDKEIYKFRWFSDTRYLKGKGTVKVTLAKTLKEYLLGLTQQYTKYELYNILALKSKYSIRLFELFKSYSYQHEKEFNIDDLKNLLFATNYINFKDFRKRVLENAINEINTYTELSVDYNTISKGRKVIAIRFIITKKEMLDSYMSYRKTIDKINENNNQIKGQLSIFDLEKEREIAENENN